MGGSAAAPFHVGLTPERVVDIALELTGESHLLGWSIRDLAGRLNVTPSVVYHHVGGKDLIARRVVERVLDGFSQPPAALAWDDWFRSLLHGMYPALTRYAGTAKWLLMHGPSFPAVAPIVDAGIDALTRGGFGERAGLAYVTLLNNALLTVSVGDDRLVHEEDGPRDHASMMREFQDVAHESPGVALLSDEMITPFARGGDAAARQREHYYRSIIEVTLSGVAATLLQG